MAVPAVCGGGVERSSMRSFALRHPQAGRLCPSLLRPRTRLVETVHRPAAAFISNQPARARVGAPEPSGVKNAALYGRTADALPETDFSKKILAPVRRVWWNTLRFPVSPNHV
jgi:hypothetical protein